MDYGQQFFNFSERFAENQANKIISWTPKKNSMQDRTLLAAATILAVAGIAAIALILQFSQVTATPIEQAKLQAGNEVTIRGQVMDIQKYRDVTVLKVGYDTSLDVALFDDPKVRVGQKVTVTGKAKQYNGRMEIVAERIVIT